MGDEEEGEGGDGYSGFEAEARDEVSFCCVMVLCVGSLGWRWGGVLMASR